MAGPGSPTASAKVRRYLPAAVALPLLLGVLRWGAEEAGLVGAAVADVVLVLALAVFAGLVVLFFARLIEESERERLRAERAEAEALPALARRAEELERANTELADAKAQLERSNEELQRFATVASHDLREPLRVVSGFAELLGKRYGGQLEGEGARFVKAITGGVERMDEMISDLLAYARAGRSDRPREPVDCNELVAETLASLQVAITEAGADVDVAKLPTVTADRGALRQLFQNLIANGVKFAADEAPRVSIWAAEVPGGWRFTVRDNGIGIDPADAERVFGMFTRLHSTERYPGTGVGLAVCQRIVEAHGGRIWVEAAPSGGSQFMFTLASGDGAARPVL